MAACCSPGCGVLSKLDNTFFSSHCPNCSSQVTTFLHLLPTLLQMGFESLFGFMKARYSTDATDTKPQKKLASPSRQKTLTAHRLRLSRTSGRSRRAVGGGQSAAARGRPALSPTRLTAVGRGGRGLVAENAYYHHLCCKTFFQHRPLGPLVADAVAEPDRRGRCRMAPDQGDRGRARGGGDLGAGTSADERDGRGRTDRSLHLPRVLISAESARGGHQEPAAPPSGSRTHLPPARAPAPDRSCWLHGQEAARSPAGCCPD